MSELHRAVRAELDAYSPEVTPPFGTVVARRSRQRDRRRAAGAALLVGAAVAALAVVPQLLSDSSRTSSVAAAPSPPTPSPSRSATSCSYEVQLLTSPSERVRVDLHGGLPYSVTVPVGTALRVRPAGGCVSEAAVSLIDGVALHGGFGQPDDVTPVLTPGGTRDTMVATAAGQYRLSITCDDRCATAAFLGQVEVKVVPEGLPATVTCTAGQVPLEPQLVGLTEAQALAAGGSITAGEVRVVGRDGVCLPVLKNSVSSRADLVVTDGVVVWAGYF